MRRHLSLLSLLAVLTAACATISDDGSRLATVDHYVRVKSTAPAFAGQDAQIYVREVALAGMALRGAQAADRVVLFVHGAGTPAEVTFDVPYKDYSWMAYLAKAGFDVFAMDMTGYGRSTRPPAMNDPCNLSKAQQAQFVPNLIPAPCAPSHPSPITTMDSDWNDIGAVVDHLRALRRVDKVSLVGWSQGGPRAAGYAARNPEKVARLVVLAPAYTRASPLEAPNPLPASSGPMTAQSQADFKANWDRQVGCPEQYEPAASAAVWTDMLASDPVGATWGAGVRRAPQVPTWGFNQAVVARMRTPFLMVTGVHDKQVAPERVRDLYADLGSRQKVIIELACSSHNAMWEKNRLLLFKASLEWLKDGKVNGMSEGELKLGS
ncbi:MAG TPA: alpha/beta fold hydrolase [Burkholderiales bacterium]|nr:alpha/beta fold hydrolase [Burkholderiales bacterium]